MPTPTNFAKVHATYLFSSCRHPFPGTDRFSGEDQFTTLVVKINDYVLPITHLALQDSPAERRLDLPLNRAFERSRAVIRVIAGAHQMLFGGAGQLDLDVSLGESMAKSIELNLHNHLQVFLRERVEDDDFIHAVEKLRPEVIPHLSENRFFHSFVTFTRERPAILPLVFEDAIAPDIRGHDDNRVLEIDHPALPIGQPPVVEDLQQQVEDIVVSLLDLIEEDHRVGTSSHGFRQLTALLIADITWWSSDQAGDRVLLLVFGHIDPDHRVFVIEEKFCERPGQFGLTDTGRAEEDKTADGSIWVFESRARADHGFGDSSHRFVLADDAAVQLLFELQ